MLSSKAKVVRGEASKRINVLLHEWRSYKQRAESELRDGARKNERLQSEMLVKEDQIRKLLSELSSYRGIVLEQRKAIEELVNKCSDMEKYKDRHSSVEQQLCKEKEVSTRLNREIRSYEARLHKSAAEIEALTTLNSELKAVNVDQKNRLVACEKDVMETSHELEMLETMVGTLYNRKSEFDLSLTKPTLLAAKGDTTPSISMGGVKVPETPRPETSLSLSMTCSETCNGRTSSQKVNITETDYQKNSGDLEEADISSEIESLENILSAALSKEKNK